MFYVSWDEIAMVCKVFSMEFIILVFLKGITYVQMELTMRMWS